MPGRRWTVLIVPHGSGKSKSIEIAQSTVRSAVGFGLVLSIAVLLLGVATISRGVNISRARRLAEENRLLSGQLQHVEHRLSVLQDTIARVTERDEQVRMLAGLPITDPEVQQAGIGGPTTPWAERDSLTGAGTLGRRAINARTELDGLLRRASLLASSFTEARDTLQFHSRLLESTPSIMPTAGFLSSRYSQSRIHPIFHEPRPHLAIDVSAPLGTEIVAPAAGRVRYTRRETGYGLVVTIEHGFGVLTKYAHCEKVLVKPGQRVKRGDKLATVGKTGVATAPHLHYEVLVNGRPKDPTTFIFPQSIVD